MKVKLAIALVGEALRLLRQDKLERAERVLYKALNILMLVQKKDQPE